MTNLDAFPETRVAPEDDPNRPKRSGRSLRERFEAFVSPEPMSGCFLWTGFAARSWGESGLGYGRFRLDGSRTDKTRNIIMQAHRVAILLETGTLPPRRMHVLHSCDNPLCVNPRHLRLGTDRDNFDDMSRRGRVGFKMLREDEVLAVRAAAANGVSYAALARRFGITDSGIRRVVLRQAWRHV